MIAVALVTEAQQTEQVITALIVLLLVVAALLSILTIWYWRHTSPRRAGRRVRRSVPSIDLDDPRMSSGANRADQSHPQEYAPTAMQAPVVGQPGRR